MRIIKEVSTGTGVCPTCGSKYLLATNYCVKCKKKVKKEKKKESSNLKELNNINPFIELISEAIYESLNFYPDGMMIEDWKDHTYSAGDMYAFSVRSSNDLKFNCENPNTGELSDGVASVLLITSYEERLKQFITKANTTGMIGKDRFSKVEK